MTIEVCPYCRGSGMGQRMKPCTACKGTGYPRGYTPPTREEVIAWLERMRDIGGVAL